MTADLAQARFGGGGGEDFAEEGEDFGDAEGLLQEGGFAAGRSFRAGIGEVAGHVNDGGLGQAGGGYGFEKARGGFAAVHEIAPGGKMQVDEKNVVGGVLAGFGRRRKRARANLEIGDPGVRRVRGWLAIVRLDVVRNAG
jgi:hypothetical protein